MMDAIFDTFNSLLVNMRGNSEKAVEERTEIIKRLSAEYIKASDGYKNALSEIIKNLGGEDLKTISTTLEASAAIYAQAIHEAASVLQFLRLLSGSDEGEVKELAKSIREYANKKTEELEKMKTDILSNVYQSQFHSDN